MTGRPKVKHDPVRVLIADDHSVVRSGLRLVLESAGQYAIVGEAADGGELLELAATSDAELVIIDVSMPGMGGIEATRLLRARHPAMKILALTVHSDEEYVYQMLKAGANGYLLKSAGKDSIFQAVNAVLAGAVFFSPTVSDLIVQSFVERAGAERGSAEGGSAKAERLPGESDTNGVGVQEQEETEPTSPLTKREAEVLTLIAEGMTNREIGDSLYISARTVNTHRTNLMQKLDLHDTAALVRYAAAHGLIAITPATPSNVD